MVQFPLLRLQMPLRVLGGRNDDRGATKAVSILRKDIHFLRIVRQQSEVDARAAAKELQDGDGSSESSLIKGAAIRQSLGGLDRVITEFRLERHRG